jgi:hypothetical protein
LLLTVSLTSSLISELREMLVDRPARTGARFAKDEALAAQFACSSMESLRGPMTERTR